MKYAFSIMAVIFIFITAPVCTSLSTDPFEKKRNDMVEHDIKARGIKDRNVLGAMLKVQRHLFVGEAQRNKAYNDHPLPIGEGQTISQPYIVAAMTEALELKGNERVLEIGTGSGYQAAVLAEIVKEVYTIEIKKGLCDQGRERLSRLGYRNVQVRCGDGYFGWPEYAPFDAVMVTAAASRVPQPLLDQLKEGGRLVMPVGSNPLYQNFTLVKKEKGKYITRELGGVVFVPMTGEAQRK